MPALLIPVITSALSATALSSTAIAATAFISANVIVAGAALGLSALLSPDTAQKVASQQYQSRQAMPTLLYGYGATKLGGAKFEFDTGRGIYCDGLIHCAGPVNRVVQWMLNDQNATGFNDTTAKGQQVSGDNQTAPWGANVSIDTHKGINDSAPGYLTDVLAGRWTADHRLRGLFYSVMVARPTAEKNFQKAYPNGPPALYVVAELAPVYDPRDASQNWDDPATWKYSDNVALALLHYLTAIRGADSVTGQPVPYGFGFAHSRIDLPSFIAYANVCDQAVTLKAGGTEKRYRIGGTFDMGAEERRTVLNRILSTGDAEIYQGANGRIAVRGGEWTAPTVTITEKHILGYDFEGGADKLAAFNRLKISFSDPKNDYQVIEADPWDDLAAQVASPNGATTQDLSLPMVQSHAQARRLAKIAMAKANPTYKLTLTTDLYGLLALGERTIKIALPELGIDTTFLVTSFTEAADGTCKIGVSSFGPEAYAWTPGAEEGVAPAIADTTKQPTIVPDVVNPALAVERFTANGNVTVLGVKVTVAAPSNTAFKLIGRTRIVGSGTAGWVDMSDVGNPWSLSYRPVNEGQSYEVQVAFQAPFNGTQGPWVSAGTLTTTADANAPSAPVYTSASLGGGTTVSHVVRQSPSANARNISLSRANGFGKVFADAALSVTESLGPNQPDTLTDTISLGYITWWLTAQNGSGVSSGPGASQSLLYVTQPGNLTQFPSDLTNAVWVKTNVTAAINGTGPDGASATMVAETTANGGHSIAYRATGLTSGGKVRAAWGLKAAGRFNGRLDLIDTNGSAFARLLFDLTAGTVTTSTNSGGIFTATTASIVKLPNDWWLVIFQATAATTAVESRLTFGNDAKVMSYAGDTTKGILAWACSFAPVT